MSAPTPDFKELTGRMRRHLTRIARLRRVVRVLLVIVYSATLLWFAFCLFGGYLLASADYATNVLTSQYILYGFIFFCVLHFALMRGLQSLGEQETSLMGRIVGELFPEARLNPAGGADREALAASRLFSESTSLAGFDTTSYGRLEIPVGEQSMQVFDVGITPLRGSSLTANPLTTLYRSIIRPIFGARVESTMHTFRGMFGYCRTQREFRGYVLLLPDHLENRVGYLAQTIQRIRQKNGAKFVHLEDPEFESLFAVYADDEVEARMVLTPAMMRRMTELRRSFNRDLMLAFRGDTFYFASETPDGFLRPGRRSLGDERLLEQLYREIGFCRIIESEMKQTLHRTLKQTFTQS